MTFAFTLLSLSASGLAVLHLARLQTGRFTVDLPLAWFVGSGWFALGAMTLRFVGSVPYSRAAVMGILLAPVLLWTATRAARWRAGAAPAQRSGTSAARWLPRPRALFVPMAGYVVFMAAVTCLHGFNTPTQADDAVGARAFTPMLAFDDEWGSAAKPPLVMTGGIPTFVPSLAWRLTCTVDHFHVNYVVLADLVALLILCVTLAATRGAPERGWCMGFALLSLPLFVYHCTSTYQDAVLAMYVGTGFLWFLEYGRTREVADAGRALLLLALATMVKREGLLVAVAIAAPLLVQLVWSRRRGFPVPWASLSIAGAFVILHVIAMAAAAGILESLPFLRIVAAHGSPGPLAYDAPLGPAARAFGYALFQSGNAGMLYWVLPAVLVLRPREATRGEFGAPLLGVAALFALTAASALWLAPVFTVNQMTVHRSLLAVSVAAALWVSAVISRDACAEQRSSHLSGTAVGFGPA